MSKIIGIQLFSLPEIAEATGASISTLRNAIKSKKLKARKVGREYKCTRHEICTYLKISNDEELQF